MAAADTSHSDDITFEEFYAHAWKRRILIKEVFDELRGDEERLTTARLLAGLETLHIKVTDAEIRERMMLIDASHAGDITFKQFRDWLLLLPDVSPRAFFETFNRSGLVDDQQGAHCHNLPANNGTTAWAVATKLLSGAIAGCLSRTATAPVDRYVYVCICMCMYAYTCVYIYTYIYKDTYICVCIYMEIHIYICTYIYIYI